MQTIATKPTKNRQSPAPHFIPFSYWDIPATFIYKSCFFARNRRF